jgi:hypothetical protein
VSFDAESAAVFPPDTRDRVEMALDTDQTKREDCIPLIQRCRSCIASSSTPRHADLADVCDDVVVTPAG